MPRSKRYDKGRWAERFGPKKEKGGRESGPPGEERKRAREEREPKERGRFGVFLLF